MENNTLQHHGVLGQKWGVRRYQNLDGSLTTAGRKHTKSIVSTTDKDKIPEFMKVAKDHGINPAANRAYQKRLDKMIKNARFEDNHEDNHEDHNKAHDKSKSVKSMGDAELRERINRLQLEQQYSTLSNKDIKTGKDYANALLKAEITAATATTTALTIYNNYDKIKEIITNKFLKK